MKHATLEDTFIALLGHNDQTPRKGIETDRRAIFDILELRHNDQTPRKGIETSPPSSLDHMDLSHNDQTPRKGIERTAELGDVGN